MGEIRLEEAEVTSATIIQNAIDVLGEEGGRVILPAMDLVVDRGIEMQFNVSLVGQGGERCCTRPLVASTRTVGLSQLRHARRTLMYTEGLGRVMTVTIRTTSTAVSLRRSPGSRGLRAPGWVSIKACTATRTRIRPGHCLSHHLQAGR